MSNRKPSKSSPHLGDVGSPKTGKISHSGDAKHHAEVSKAVYGDGTAVDRLTAKAVKGPMLSAALTKRFFNNSGRDEVG